MSKGYLPGSLAGASLSGLPEQGLVVVGFSGGADSTALAHWLKSQVDPERILLAHVNHMLRGEEAQRDEAAAREFARAQGLRFALFRADVKALAAQRGQGLEECGREVRYSFFHSLLEKEGNGEGAILTAHNADDNAETILLNLCRGASLSGLCGIPRERGAVLRPLLRVSREEVEAYCRFWGLPFVTDSTNLSDDYRRNLLRHRVMPVLKEINPAFLQAAARTAESCSLFRGFLEGQAENLLIQASCAGGLNAACLRQADPALRRQAVKLFLEKAGCRGLETKHLEQAERLLEAGGRCSLPGNLTAECFQGVFRVGKPFEGTAFEQPVFPGENRLPGGKILILEKKNRLEWEKYQKIHNLLFENSFDYDTITGDFLARTRRAGDRFLPAGRRGSKSLKQLFQELKTPASQRGGKVLLVCGGSIVFCEGAGVAGPFRITGKTKTVGTVQVVNLPGDG